MFNAIQTALSGLVANSKRVDASAQNIAHMNVTGSLTDPENAPYTPVTTVQESQGGAQNGGARNGPGGVLAENVPGDRPFVPAYAPDSPFADENGIVGAPNVNLAAEIVNLKVAEYSYKANLGALETAQDMTGELIDLLDTDS